MAEPLEIDLDFRTNDSDARQALSGLSDSADRLAGLVSDAFTSAQGVAQALGGVDASPLEAAATAIGQLQDVNLSGVQDVSSSLGDAVSPADQIAASLVEASSAADGLSAASAIDPSGAEQMALFLDDAHDAAVEIGNGLQLDLFSEAAVSVESISTGLGDAADNAGSAAAATGDMASGLDDAAAAFAALDSAAADTDASLAAVSGSQDKVKDSVGQTAASQRESNTEAAAGVDIASRLGAEFEKIQAKVGGLVGPMSQFTDQALSAVQALEGTTGAAAGGLTAGVAGLLTAGESFKKASDTITLATGATGSGLESLQSSFKTALSGSGRSAQDLAQILGDLSRDTGASGDGLAKLTDKTAAFLKVTGGSVGDVRTLTQVMKALGLQSGDLTTFQDQLTASQKAFGGQIGTLLSQIKTAGPVLATLGFNPGQITGLVGEFDQAGLSVQRLIPGFTKLAQSATENGQTASEAFNGLIDKIKSAGSLQAGLNEVQGVFSGRVAASFVGAVQSGTISVDKLNQVLAASPGTVSRLGDSVKGLSGQLGGIKNDILAAFGQAGLPFIEGLRQGIEDIRPTLRSLFDAISAFTPAFRGFAEVLLLPVEGLRLLDTPLHLLSDVLHLIPAPVLEVVGAFVAMQVLPLGIITRGLTGIGSALMGFLTFGGGPAGAIEGITGAISAINPVTLAAAAGMAVLLNIMQDRAKAAQEMKDKVEALKTTLGDIGTTAEGAAPKLDQLLQSGSKGKLISDDELGTLAKAGISIEQYRGFLQKAATDPNQDITKQLRQSLLDSVGGIQNLTAQFNQGNYGREAEGFAKTAHGAKSLTDEFVNQGTTLGSLDPKLRDLLANYNDIIKAEDKRAKAQIDQMVVSGQVSVVDRDAGVATVGLKKEKENEAAVRDALVKKVNEEKVAKEGLSSGDAAEDQRRADALDALEKEGGLHDQIAATLGTHSQAVNELAAASRNGVASDEDRVRITGDLVKSGLSQEDAAKALTTAEKDLQAIQAKYAGNSAPMNDALKLTFTLIGQGTDTWDALSGAAQTTGVAVTDLGPAFDALNSQLQKFAPPVQAGADVMSTLISDMQAGLPIQSTFADLLKASGGNADVAFAALNDYQQGVKDTTKALDDLAPSLGSVVDKLIDQSKLTVGPDSASQDRAIKDQAASRKADLEQQISDLKDAKNARSDASDADIEAQKAALRNQKSIAQDAAKARGEAFDSTDIDLQIKALKARSDTTDLDQQISDLEAKQKDVDAAQERAQAALGTFNAEEQAIRANASLRDSDLAQQQAQLTSARDIAAQQAAARGEAFDPGPINAKIAAIQGQRDTIGGMTAQALADAQSTSDNVQKAVDDAQGGLLNFQTVLDTFDAQNVTKAQEAATVAQLRADGLTSTVKALFDPSNGLSAADQSAFLNAIATASPEEKAAIETHAASSLELLKQKNDAIKAAGDIFADPNPTFTDHAKTRGEEMAQGLAAGVVTGLSDSKINDIIGVAIQTGSDPTVVRDYFQKLGFLGGTDMASGAKTGFGANPITPEDVKGFGAAAPIELVNTGSDGGAALGKAAREQMGANPITVEDVKNFGAAAPIELASTGDQGGQLLAQHTQQAMEQNPISGDTAATMMAQVQAQYPISGSEGGIRYVQAASDTMRLYPIPAETGTILVSSVSEALSVSGTDAGANYALSVAAGIAARQGDAIEAAHLMAIRVDAAGHVGLEAASPSKKGLRLGGYWAQGLALGIEAGIPKVADAARKAAAVAGFDAQHRNGVLELVGAAAADPPPMDGPGFDRVVRAVARIGAANAPRRRQPFGGK